MKKFFLLSIVFSLLACSDDLEKKQHDPGAHAMGFEKMDKTGITFSNDLTEDEKQNYLNFEYMYNGGGVSVGDINNDGLSDIYFTGNEVPNKLYLNQGHFKFKDITATAGVAGDDGWITGSSMVDINGDGWLDIYVCKSNWTKNQRKQQPNLLFINQKDGTFKESAAEFGLDDNGYSIQASFFDFDLDGDLDVYITNHPMEFGRPVKNRDKKFSHPPDGMSDKLYLNEGGSFKDISKKAGIVNYAHSLGVITSDINNDGYPDIYLTNDYDEPDILYINQKDGTFKNQINQMTNHISWYAMGVDIADINNDGFEDIITTEMLPDDYKRSKTNMASMDPDVFYGLANKGFQYQYMHNALQLNRGNGFFSEISQLAGVSKTDWSWACLLVDFDNDRLRDLFIANGYKRDVFDKDFAIQSAKIIEQNDGVIPLHDIYEIMPSTKLKNFIYKNRGDLTFENKTSGWHLDDKTLTQGTAVGDFDNDGDLDIVLNNLDDKAIVYKNRLKSNHYLRLKLNAGPKNTYGLGTKVKLMLNNGEVLYQEFKTVRGYQSSIEPIMHFGLGDIPQIDEIFIKWPTGEEHRLKNVKADQLLKLSITDPNAIKEHTTDPTTTNTIFKEVSDQVILPPFTHRENEFDDYYKQVLLPHRLSRLGPFITVGDVNGDGLEDFYVGGAKNQSGRLYVQLANGTFKIKNNPVFSKDKWQEDLGTQFFDADGDKDLDLYVVSGGTELPAKHKYYQDRLYINNGQGVFSASSGLPKILSSGSCVIAQDYDQDGDIDLFVGGRVIPDVYPYTTPSYLLQNNGQGVFQNIAVDNKRLSFPGLVTSAVWTDFNADGAKDLIVVGEWMPIRFFQNVDNGFVEVTEQYGMMESVGWWNKIVEVDYDQDGDKDYIIGNLGLNYKFHATPQKPFHVYAGDFDNNGVRDIVLAKYDQDKQVPVRGRQCSSEQMPFIAQKFKKYKDFAEADISEMLGDALSDALHYKATIFESIILVNEGGQFIIKALPSEAQFSAVQGIVASDFDADGHQDLFIAGNLFGSEPETSRADASIGVLLKMDNDKKLIAVPPSKSGISLPYDVKDLNLIRIKKGNKKAVLVSSNNDQLRLLMN